MPKRINSIGKSPVMTDPSLDRYAGVNIFEDKVNSANEIWAGTQPADDDLLVSTIAKNAHLTKDQASDALDAVLGVLRLEMNAHGRITLPGFGIFTIKKQPAVRTRHTLRTGGYTALPTKKPAAKKAAYAGRKAK